MQSIIFTKSSILDVSLGSEYVWDYRLWIRLWIHLCFFYYYFHFESIKFRRSRSQTSFIIDVFKNFAIFTGKRLSWSILVTKLLASKPANLLGRDSNTCFLMNIAKFLRTALFIEHLRWLFFQVMFEISQNFTMKSKKGFY